MGWTQVAMTSVVGLLLIVGCQPVPKANDQPRPAVIGAHVSSGERLYQEHCAVCHGPRGRGDGYAGLQPPPADLTSPKVSTQLAPQLIKTVHEGRANTAMGAWKQLMSDQDIEDVVAFLRRLRE